MSFCTALVKPQTLALVIIFEISLTELKSPGEEIGKPASIISTPNSSSFKANSTFSVVFNLQPGTCSPSRRVVSKMCILLADIEFVYLLKQVN